MSRKGYPFTVTVNGEVGLFLNCATPTSSFNVPPVKERNLAKAAEGIKISVVPVSTMAAAFDISGRTPNSAPTLSIPQNLIEVKVNN